MSESENIIWPGWETGRLIGRGSFGAVYEIQRQMFDDVEKAALKVISIPQSASDVAELYSDGYDADSITETFRAHLKSIVSEYSLMRKMNGSSNIVNCDDVRYIQHDDGIGWDIFIKMELLTPLTETLTNATSDNTVVRIAQDICEALVLCSKHGIVHRDIKPQNIFVSPNGDYKLGDFGIAKTVEKTMGGTKIGTYKYMAPEVYNNQPYSSSADIYSLGLVLYWLLNERRMPFMPLPPAKPKAGQDEEARRRRLSGEELPAPAHGSDELKRIVLKACAYDPKDRYTTAAAMLEDLDRLEGGVVPVVTAVISGDHIESYEDDKTTGPVFGDRQNTNIKKNRENTDFGAAMSETARFYEKCDTTAPEHKNQCDTERMERDLDATVGPAFASKLKHEREQEESCVESAREKRKWYKVITCLVLILSVLVVLLLQLKFSDIGEEDRTSPTTRPTESAENYNVSWETDSRYDITVVREFSPEANAKIGVLSNGDKIYDGDVLTVEYSAKPGYVVSSTGNTNITVSKNITEADIYATVSLENYTVSWKIDAAYDVTIERIASPNGGVTAGKIENGGTVYYGDVLSITYTAKPGFTIEDAGSGEITVTGNITDLDINAAMKAESYTVSWKTDASYAVTVERSASPTAGAAIGRIENGGTVYYGDVLSVTYTASTGYSINSQGSTSITVTENVTSSTIYATTTVNSYKSSWNTGTGYTITVKRTSSPLKGASIGALNNGATVYHGDVLLVTYKASTGYSLGSKGSTSITVSGNVTSSVIYTSASPNSYTYKIVYKSSNGTALGSTTATYKYGTTNTISAPAKSGYTTPGSRSVKWDSTSAKTITFTYTPAAVSNSAITGALSDSPRVGCSTTMNYRNRTANSVEVQITTTVTMQSEWPGYVYGVAFDASCGSASTGKVQVAGLNDLRSGGNTCTASSGWVKVSLNTTNATTVSFDANMYNTDWQNNYINDPDYAYRSYTWTMNIPAY